MRLTLVIPGLLWPRQALHDTVFDLSLPAMETLLGFGTRTHTPQRTLGEWWRDSFALPEMKLPSAALRLLALGVDPVERCWLCADPVHLGLDRQGASLSDPARLELDDAEASTLHASLAPLFAEFGDLHCDTPLAWHLALNVAPPTVIDDLRDMLGRPADGLLPPGDAGPAAATTSGSILKWPQPEMQFGFRDRRRNLRRVRHVERDGKRVFFVNLY